MSPIPGKTETLRISGEAGILRDAALRDSMAVDGKDPALAMVVYVERVFMHCPKCMIRGYCGGLKAGPTVPGFPTSVPR